MTILAPNNITSLYRFYLIFILLLIIDVRLGISGNTISPNRQHRYQTSSLSPSPSNPNTIPWSPRIWSDIISTTKSNDKKSKEGRWRGMKGKGEIKRGAKDG